MHATEYRALRKSIGTQAEVAGLLEVAQKQISDRETGKTRISKSDEFALRWLGHLKSTRAEKALPQTGLQRRLSPLLKKALVKKLGELPEVFLAERYFERGLGPKCWRGRPFKVIAYREEASSSGVMVTIQGKPRSRRIDVDSFWLRHFDPGSGRYYPLVG